MAGTTSVTIYIPPPYSHHRGDANVSHNVLSSPDSFSDPLSMNSKHPLDHSSCDNNMALERVIRLDRPLTVQGAANGAIVPLTIKGCTTDSEEHTIHGTPGARPRADSITFRNIIRVANDDLPQFSEFLTTIYDKLGSHHWSSKSVAVGSYRLVVALHYIRETIDTSALQQQQMLSLCATNWHGAISIIHSAGIRSVGISALWWPDTDMAQATHEDTETESEDAMIHDVDIARSADQGKGGHNQDEEIEQREDRRKEERDQEAVSCEVEQNSFKGKWLPYSSKLRCCVQ